ncbi:MAG: hypothetical protein WB760_26475 [Xanthobacteraceae bacterium]
MKILVIAVLALLVATPALASHHPAPAAETFIDVAARPSYAIETIAPLRRGWRHKADAGGLKYRRCGKCRRTGRDETAARYHPTPPKVEQRAAIPAPVSPPPATEASQAAKLGDLLGIVGGYEDGIATSISASVEALAENVGVEIDRAYLVTTACPGYTMERQGVEVAIGRLNPIFVQRLATANREARAAGIPVCIFSAYRPPSFGIGGFRDKFESAHSYGLAVDQGGLSGAGSRDAIIYRKIAARHGVYGPYSVYSRAEFNHFQPTRVLLVADAAPLRRTITADGPRLLERMWKVADAIISPEGLSAVVVARRQRRYTEHRYHERHRRYASR